MKPKRDNIETIVLRGSGEVKKAFGITKRELSEMRSNGLKCYTKMGRIFFYYPADIEQYIKENWKIDRPEIKFDTPKRRTR